jgi:hypothetical protein
MKFDELLKARTLAESLYGIWEFRESIDNQFSNAAKVSIVFSEDMSTAEFDGIEMSYVLKMLDTVEDDLKTQLRLLGVVFRNDPVAEEPFIG